MGPERDKRDNREENKQHDTCDAHQAGVGDVTRAFRLDSSDGRDSGDKRSGDEPGVPGHAAWDFKSRADRVRAPPFWSGYECGAVPSLPPTG